MNRLRSAPTSPHTSIFVALILAAVVAITGGIMHAVAKNSQVQVERQIDQALTRIDQTRVKIRMIEVRTDKELDRFVLRERLANSGMPLVAITAADIEEVLPPAMTPLGAEVASVRDQP